MLLIARGFIDSGRVVFSVVAKQPDILARFGQRVRELRLARGWSQEAFADECGLDRTYVVGSSAASEMSP